MDLSRLRNSSPRGRMRLAGLALGVVVAVAGVTAAGAHAASAGPGAGSGSGRVTGRANGRADGHAVIAGYYYPSSGMPVSSIPAGKLTDVIYAFSLINSSGKCYIPSSEHPAREFAALAALKRRHPGLKTEISIGGWGAGGFSDAALTPRSRAAFVSSCVGLFFGKYRGAFDGIDLDWEFPVSGGPPSLTSRPSDKAHYTLLLRRFRAALDAAGARLHEHLLLTAALPAGRLQSAGPYDPAHSYQLPQVGKLLDWTNLMTYDLEDGYSKYSGFDSPMNTSPADPTSEAIKKWNSVAGATDFYERHGVPADKIVLGEPYFSLAFKVASARDDGLYQPITGPATAPSWSEIASSYLKNPAWSRHWSQTAQAPWLFDAKKKTFITYDDPASLLAKSEFARERGLRGVFTWALDEDDAQHSLLDAMSAPFRR
ncbi:MAG: glycoside hydrolase family 18 protein [Nocardiopsaceae bacterium]|nr:glycoside hydrolase family 18 protein [Nocardiopsaceae bacterium]